MRPSVQIRPEEPGDWSAIHALHEAVFGRAAEADLVDRLREDGDLVLSLVACTDQHVGHIAFSCLMMPSNPVIKACALAPLAVYPDFQNVGLGSSLVTEGLRWLREDGWDLALVLGEPAYYGRFGFTKEAASALRTPYDGPYLQALPLSERGHEARGPVAYARAFTELA